MPPERAEHLRRWHEDALARGRRDEPVTVEAHGLTLVVPADVYAPNPLGLAEVVRSEVRAGESVLDLGTGSGVNGLVAAAAGGAVVAVDVNPAAVAAARENAAANDLLIDARVSDVFAAVPERFDLVLFDPPFRWFPAADLYERATADEGYAALTTFFREVGEHLLPGGRILLSFGTTGDVAYLEQLIDDAGLRSEELRRVKGERDGFPVAYFAWRLTPR
jgi:release factor glutamine methyltransferase